ncbi:relaxase/mobilization nuclease domain-containing protein [Collinsella tanakaei]|uniref:relaxase/mobilization nuclease domain-containing protein n=1 Tax=Collinsella tanakaei TaxID=626935 RepID=UPI0019570C2D|nr:relaxase/mobilization nuclease domain-containing protein [Collinsella tanakaei]MBM6756942.1 relaxase/mobilization nuclease domain-containing protein [Collinsella tanakaei]
MPYLKFINGHSKTLYYAWRYLEGEDGSRMVAFDGINMIHHSLFDENLRWWELMDERRKSFDNNRSMNDKRPRTYMHFIVSPDPRDNISLEEFRRLVTEWGEKFFNGSKLGRYEVAVIYHDDNKERIEKGGEGILHAHIIVNNTDLSDGKRIAPKLSRRIINDMYFEINKAALAAGYHGFASDGKSYTQREMIERGLNPSRNRNDARYLDSQIDDHDIVGEEVVLDDIDPQIASQRIASPEEMTAARAPKETRNSPDFQMVFATGEVYGVYERAPRSHRTMPERHVLEREGHTWKDDIRGRVDVALRLAGSTGEFKQILDLLEIDVTYNKRGDIKYCMRGEGNRAKQVLGKTIGARYTGERVNRTIGKNRLERIQRRTSDAPMQREITPAERDAVIETALEAEPGTREGHEHLKRLRAFLKYNDAHNIKSYDDYPDTKEGRVVRAWAEEHHAFDPRPFIPISLEEHSNMSLKDKIAYRELLRQQLGYGGGAYGEREGDQPGIHRQDTSGGTPETGSDRDRAVR